MQSRVSQKHASLPPQPVLATVCATAGQNLVVWCLFPFVTNGAAVGAFEHPLNSRIPLFLTIRGPVVS